MANARTLLVTGGQGFVAGSILAQAGEEWEVHALTRGHVAASRPGMTWHQADPLAPGVLAGILRTLRPAAVIHTAAAADIDYCQNQPEQARLANVELTRLLVEGCRSVGARLVHCSTDTVFDGEHAPYRVDDVPRPVNFYGETKVAAEALVGSLGTLGVVARLALVVGLPVMGAGNSWLARLVETARAGLESRLTTVEVRTPIDVITLGRALLELAAGPHHGIFHLAGASRVNRYEMGCLVAKRLGLPLHLMVASEAAASPGRAPRPRDVSLDISRTNGELRTRLLPLAEGLEEVLNFQKRSAGAVGGAQAGISI